MALKLSEQVVTHVKPHPPLRDQLADHIRQQILTGKVKPGDIIPSEPKIAELTGINRSTVRFALSLLADEGLIRRGHGKPTIIAEPPRVRILNTNRYAEELARLRAGQPPETAFVTDHGADWDDYTIDDPDYSEQTATDEDRRLLGITARTKVMRRRVVKRLDRKPIQIQRSAVPLTIAKGTVLADPTVQPYAGGVLAELYDTGLIPDDARLTVTEEVSARPPNMTERRLLAMEITSDVWDIVRVFLVDGVPVEASRVIAPVNSLKIRYETTVS